MKVLGAALAIAVSLLAPTAVWAHEQRAAGSVELVVGWSTEPAYAGAPNAVSVSVTHDGRSVERADLDAIVIFGGREASKRTEPLPLEAVFGKPGAYEAPIVPTRPGTYTFHVSGTLSDGERVDEYFTSGEETFDDVRDPAGEQFPVRDPSTGQIASRISTLEDRVESAPPPRLVLIVAVLALLIAIAAFLRSRRKA